MLNKAPLGRKLILIVAAALVGMAALVWIGLHTLNANLRLDRSIQTENLVRSAISGIDGLYQAMRDGAMTEAEAQILALDILRSSRYGQNDYFFVLNSDVVMLAHPLNPSLDGRNLANIQDPNGTRLFVELVEGAQRGARQGSGVHVPYYWERTQGSDPIEKISYAEYFEPWGWIIATGIYIDDVDEIYEQELLDTLLICLLVAGVMGGVSIVLSRSVTGPLSRLSVAMRSLAAGNHGVEIPSRDWTNEVGRMAATVQIFKENAIEKVQLEAEQKAAAERAEHEKKDLMATLANGFEGSIGLIVQAVTSAATEMQSTSQSMSAISDEANRQSTTVAAAAQEAAANVQTVAAAAEQLGGSITEISSQVQQQRDVAGVASEAAAATDEDITALAGRAEKIGEVIGLITGIAEQTNLLALNATIEAARAGEAGKGFAVVASEVKSLSNQTGRATEQIADQIRAMQDQTGRTVTSIRTITAKIEELNEISAAVAASVQQQNAATQEIARNANEAATGTEQVTRSIDGVSQAASEVGGASSEVLTAAQSLSRNSAQLSDEVKEFLQGIRAM